MIDTSKTYTAAVVGEMLAQARAAERELCINIAADLSEQIDVKQALLRQQAIDAAVAAERERCAKIVEDYIPKDWMWTDAQVELPAAIRNGE